MGALPSVESHQRGLYSHRHGRNRRSEIILVPLTPAFFPSPQSPLFQRLIQARHRRTAKYYFRPPRPATADPATDFFCAAAAHSDGQRYAEEVEAWETGKRECVKSAARPPPSTLERGAGVDGAPAHATPPPPPPPSPEGAARLLADSEEGLYRLMVEDNAHGLWASDAALREAYASQLREQQRDGQAAVGGVEVAGLSAMEGPVDCVSFDAFVAGCAAARRYEAARAAHTRMFRGGNWSEGPDAAAKAAPRAHATSPAAFLVRPLPCAIVSRHDPMRPPPLDDDAYVALGDSYVKVMGAFGVFPSTVRMRYRSRAADGLQEGDGAPGESTAEVGGVEGEGAEDEFVEQHVLKGAMFVDKDVGDQILGIAVLLAAHMFVRQGAEAGLSPSLLPMLPVQLRFPLSNVPLLQFVREFRVRLRPLVEAGTARAGRRPFHAGISGYHADDLARPSRTMGQRAADEDAYLYEDDVPDVADLRRALGEGIAADSPMRRPLGTHTAPLADVPVLIVSGYNVQSAPLRHLDLYQAPLAAQRRAAVAAAVGRSSGSGRLPLLLRRKRRFRVWIEGGHFCIWASAAYARRACALLAQQLNTTVDSTAVPEPRAWRYRGLLRPGCAVPQPLLAHDVVVVAEDMPAVGLWQGDVLRCCTPAESAAAARRLPLPLPAQALEADPIGGAISAAGPRVRSRPSSAEMFSTSVATASEPRRAPLDAFWVRAAGGLDDSFTNFSDVSAMPQQRGDRASSSLPFSSTRGVIGAVSGLAACGSMGDRREGTLHLEEVILSWIKVAAALPRDSTEDDREWVHAPRGGLVTVDRYVMRRLEHDGIRYFIGLTPRFVTEQKRLEKVILGQLAEEVAATVAATETADGAGEGGAHGNGLLGLWGEMRPSSVAALRGDNDGVAAPSSYDFATHDADFMETISRQQLALTDD